MNKITISLLVVFLASLASCSKWLDIQPETQVDQEVLFSTPEGFEEALLGVYSRCAQDNLYGKELTIGTPEVLAQNYTIRADDPLRYLRTRNFEYNNANFIQRKDGIWKGLYHAVANCNLILEHMDEKVTLFAPGLHDLIKGETLALRAYLHFDALRLFAPSFANSPNAAGIPYVTAYSNQTTVMSTVTAALDSALRDLEAAKALLANDPIRDAGYIVGYPTQTDSTLNTEENNRNLFLQNRRHRMNYYAVCGALARVYLYKNDKSNALLNAREVIQSEKIPWTAMANFLAVDQDKKDRILYKELVFGWYIPNMGDAYNRDWFRENTSGMYLSQAVTQAIYETAGVGSTDQRYRQWYTTRSQNNDFISIIDKYRRNTLSDAENANIHYLMAPAIRLSELYYIAAECTYPTDPEVALAYIDAVRQHRGIGETLSVANESAFKTELLKEYRKELLAEGQLFYTYKRMNQPIPTQSGNAIPASNAIFVLPLPDDEIIYGNR
ncbi:RagB/SusD family nutrient uptake outer membrane protein [Parapedobacter tibetensis]|uniref:RagB/SusD family nutrient uptake outer membrane protein n=1 Tax=Parapedobacter tibetensis TaxID=2972951 RepID=UPI00214DB24B|nr:RagB/SusD family nutrient uptake outer membrane protein [Parapedobacter tibetensis]